MSTEEELRASFDRYLIEVDRVAKSRPTWRRGQVHFNVLSVERGDLAQRVKGSIRDPFHNDSRIPEYLAWLGQHWDAEAKS